MEAAFFDLDKTVIAKPTVSAFGRTLYDRGFISRRLLLRAAIQQLLFLQFGADHQKLEKIRKNLMVVIKGWDRTKVQALAQEAMTQVIGPIIYAEARELFREHHQAGRKVVIISSSPQEVVLPLASFLEVDDAIATRACVDKNNKYTGELEFYAYGPAKAEAIVEMAAREHIDLASSYAYSDSHTDEPMLRTVGHPVAVNPDKELRQLAAQEEWPIVDFVHPIQLREQELSLRFRIAGFVIGGSALFLLGSLLGVRRLKRQANELRATIDTLSTCTKSAKRVNGFWR